MKATRPFVFISMVAGVALVLGAVAGASSVVYPEFASYYWVAASGLTILIAGCLAWAVNFSELAPPSH